MKWINIKDSLPPDCHEVLFCVKNKKSLVFGCYEGWVTPSLDIICDPPPYLHPYCIRFRIDPRNNDNYLDLFKNDWSDFQIFWTELPELPTNGEME